MAVSVNRIISDIADRLKYEVCLGRDLLGKAKVTQKGINILGLELIGHLEDFENGKMQVIDNKGLNFLNSMDASNRRERLSKIF
jgi:serine kinase of HPr protein (carbohydrate metabolism regulator)